MDDLYVVLIFLGVSIGFLAGPVMIWLGWDGVKIKLWRWRMRSGGYDVSLFCDKNNNFSLIFKSRDGSRVRIRDGSYVSTPSPDKLYHFMGLPVRLRRENDPGDLDVWGRDSSLPMTAKEIDNTINEAESTGILQALKQYYPIVLIVVAVIVLGTAWNGYLLYQLYEAMKLIAPEIVKLFPEGLN